MRLEGSLEALDSSSGSKTSSGTEEKSWRTQKTEPKQDME
jgi:hypothetical protein